MMYRNYFATGLLSLLMVTFLAACSSTTPETYSSVAPGSDFRGMKTYGFLAQVSTDKPGYQSLETSYLKAAVTQQMNLRGIKYDAVNPDVVWNFYIHTDEKLKSRQTPAMGGGYYGYRSGYYGGFGYGGMAYETRIEQYTVGTLNIDMIDPKARQLLWEGTLIGRMTKKDQKNLEATIDEVVSEIFYKFPILNTQL